MYQILDNDLEPIGQYDCQQQALEVLENHPAGFALEEIGEPDNPRYMKLDGQVFSCTPYQSKEVLKKFLLRDDYLGIEVAHRERLLQKLPIEFRDRDELEQQVRVLALEAIEVFDPERNTKFSTYLFGHLRQKCGNLQQYLWYRRTLPLIVETDDTEDTEDAKTYDPPDDALSISSGIVWSAAFGEMLEDMAHQAPHTWKCFQQLLQFSDITEIVKALDSKHVRAKLSKTLGCAKEQVLHILAEIRLFIARHLPGFDLAPQSV